MKLYGEYTLFPGTKKQLVIPNFMTDQGNQAFLKMIARDDQGLVAGGGNWYIGLCGNAAQGITATLSSITDEVSETNNYSRQAVPRSLAGWPTDEKVNTVYRIITQEITFSASGGDFDKSFTRLFLTNVSTGTAGLLFSFSRPLNVPFLLTSGQSFPTTYTLYAGQ